MKLIEFHDLPMGIKKKVVNDNRKFLESILPNTVSLDDIAHRALNISKDETFIKNANDYYKAELTEIK